MALLVGWQEWHLAYKSLFTAIPKVPSLGHIWASGLTWSDRWKNRPDKQTESNRLPDIGYMRFSFVAVFCWNKYHTDKKINKLINGLCGYVLWPWEWHHIVPHNAGRPTGQWLVPVVDDEPTAHVVPFLYSLSELFYELVSCILYNKIKINSLWQIALF